MELFTYRRAKRPLTMICNLPEAAFVREDKNLPVMFPAATQPKTVDIDSTSSDLRGCTVRDFLNDAPFEDLEKILEILRYKVQDILYFEPHVLFFSRQDTDSEVLSNLSRAVVENSEGK